MRNTIIRDDVNKQLLMTRTFAKLSMDIRSEEYQLLQTARRDYPNYEVVARTIRRNSDKKTYHGLTYAYMEKYIELHGNDEQKKKFNEMRLIGECHTRGFSYATIKKWFLKTFPEVKQFGEPAVKEDEKNKTTEEKTAEEKTTEEKTTEEKTTEEKTTDTVNTETAA